MIFHLQAQLTPTLLVPLFTNSDLEKIDLSYSELDSCSFAGSILDKAILYEVSANYTDFSSSSLESTSILKSNLDSSSFRGSNMSEAVFRVIPAEVAVLKTLIY